MYVDGSCWMIRCKCVIHQSGEFRLGPLAVWGADSENDTKSKKHFRTRKSKRYDQQYGQSDQSNQSDAINNTTSDTVKAIKAIKAMQSTIRPKRCNQCNMTSDTIKTNPEVITGISLVALRRRPEIQAEAWYLGSWCRKIKSRAIPDSIR